MCKRFYGECLAFSERVARFRVLCYTEITKRGLSQIPHEYSRILALLFSIGNNWRKLAFTMNIGEFKYLRPKTIKEACELKDKFRESNFLAGGTFLIPLARHTQNIPKNLISLKGIPKLSEINLKRSILTIGATATLDDLAQDVFIKEKLPLLSEVLSYVSSAQIRNMATIGGSLCCGLPWVDLPIALLILDAQIEIAGFKANALVSIDDFMAAPKLVVKNKLLSNIKIKIPNQRLRYGFVRFSKTTESDLPLVSVCAAISQGHNNKQKVIFAVNFGNRFSRRLNNTEKIFKENKLVLEWNSELENLIKQEIQILETDEYRRSIIIVCFKKAVEKINADY